MIGWVAIFLISPFVGTLPGTLLKGMSLDVARHVGICPFSRHSITQLINNSLIASDLFLSIFWLMRSHAGALSAP